MKLLVTGAGGQVGTELARRGSKTDAAVTALGRADLDITDPAAVASALDRHQPAVMVNPAAYTAVDKAESEADAAFAVNRDAPAAIARACAERAVPLIHISTDYVFDGTKAEPYLETDPVRPLGVYGVSKEAGERGVREAWAHHVILRTSWVYAGHGGNFVRTMLRVGAERDTLRVVNDQTGAPTCACDIADAVLDIARRITGDASAVPWGTYHYTAMGATTWHGFAEAIFERAAAERGRRPALEAIPTSAYPTPARRPANSVLDCSKIDTVFAPPRRPWREGLAEVLGELLKDPLD